MPRRKAALRSAVRSALRACLGRRRARAGYDIVSAARELAWNSLRRRIVPSFWRRALRQRRRGVLQYAIHGEFGDALLALPFLYAQRRRCPERTLEVVIKGADTGATSRAAGDEFSEGGPRLMAGSSGRPVNFLAEFWSRVGFVDNVTEGDVDDSAYHYWQAQPAIGLRGWTVGPSNYRPFLDGLFTDDDRRRAQEVWARSARPLRLAVHLRRSAEQIATLVDEIDRSALGPAAAVAVIGSRKHETIPDLQTRHIELLDLTDNYQKGIAVMPLLQSIRAADLFIGGRGGFELFALAAGVPALTVFDEDGWWERRRLWPERLWSENPLGAYIDAITFDAGEVFATHVAPWLNGCLESESRSTAAGASGR